MTLDQIKDEVLKHVGSAPDGDQRKALGLALKAIEAFHNLPSDETTGAKAQKLADQLVPLVLTTVPGAGSYAAVVALFEPYLGDVIDWIGEELAPMKVTDKQDGPVVHDGGDDAPIV